MSARCIQCHRPMKRATASGMGRACEAKAERDPALGAQAASERVRLHIESMAEDALVALMFQAATARIRLGVRV